MSKPTLQRAPLRAIILAETSQDIRGCAGCECCEVSLLPEMDLTFRELLETAKRDDLSCLECNTLWKCDAILENSFSCSAGIDISAVIYTLRQEAILRGFHPESENQ